MFEPVQPVASTHAQRADRPPCPRRRRPRRRLALVASALALAAVLCGGLTTSAAMAAATGDISILAQDPPPPAKPSGSASFYTINLTCSNVGSSDCGANPTITIPLDPSTAPPMTSWNYAATSPIAGLIDTVGVVGNDLVITLKKAALHPGDSDTIQLSVTPPNNITPDGTSWSLKPTFKTDDFTVPAVAPTPAPGEASASARISVSKNTNDGGAVYVIGNTVTYNIVARCNAGGSTGNLYLTQGSLVDTLPAGLTFVSASPAPTTQSGQTVTWSYPDAASLPAGCSANGSGTTTYTLTARIDAGVPNNTSLDNTVTFNGTPIGEAPLSVPANRPVTVVSVPPADPGNFLGKSAKGPLNIPGLGYAGTYAGNWITPIHQRPSTNPGSAEGQYTVSVTYPVSGGYETELADPMPCLDTHTGVVYSSNTISGNVNGAASVTPRCQNPAFNPTAVQVTSASLAAAVTGGWRPIGIRPDGTTFSLTLNGTAGSSTYFDVPSGEVGHVTAIYLPRDSILTDVSLRMDVWGYGDATLKGGDVLHDIAKATAYPVNAAAPVSRQDDGDLYIQPSAPQLGVHKAFGTRGAAPDGTTALNLTGYVSTQAPLTGDVVLTDLLPIGLTWHNPSTSASFTVSGGAGGPTTSVPATLEKIDSFQGTGRTLIRVTLPKSAFTSGFYTITAPTNLIQLEVPTAATTYNNDGQLFVKGIGQDTAPVCGPGTTSVPSTFESADPLDLDGDGVRVQNHCQWSATLTVPPTGGPGFTLVKTVQGDLDPTEKHSPGIGDASEGGSGIYRLTWSNTGGKDLTDAVVYDILPYIGDTGVGQGQAGTGRGSQFATPFTGISGTLPTGVTVQYSQSTNPCRPEVYANVANPTCVSDWTSTLPGDPGLVKALRFLAAGVQAAGSSFTVGIGVAVPLGYVNTVAWNSAASDADYNGTPLLPAEPPKVGITAPAAPVTPTLSTTASVAEMQPGHSVSDVVTVGNTGGANGTLAWSLVGPVPAAGDGTCTGLDWSGAATVDSGSLPVSGNGVYTTPTTVLNGAGCYSYVQTLTGADFAGSATSPAGTAHETVLVHAAVITTRASAATILPAGTVTDEIDLAGTGTGAGTIEWKLVGPVAPAADGTCDALDWSGAATFDHGTIAVTGDGRYVTPSSRPVAVGCYSYVQLLTAASVGGPALSPAGTPGETVLVAQPSLSTTVSSASILTGGAVSDLITVSGTGGNPGSLAWQLVGPVAPGTGAGCTGLDWGGAAALAEGTIAVTGDGVYTTPAATPTAAGCYAYVVTLTGDAYGDPVLSRAGTAGELVLVSAPPVDPSVKVTVAKRVNHTSIAFGKTLTYTLTVKNAGPGTATDVTVTDTPKNAMTFVSAKPSQGTCGKRFPLTCAVGTVGAGDSVRIVVVARPKVAGNVVNSAHVTVSEPNTAAPDEVVASTKAKVLVPVRISKTAQTRTVRAGGIVKYTIAVKNATAATARKVQVCDRLPAGLVYVSATVRTQLKKGARCWTIPTIAPHTTKTFTITTRALRGASGSVVNTAQVSGSGVSPATARAGIRVLPARVRPGGVTG